MDRATNLAVHAIVPTDRMKQVLRSCFVCWLASCLASPLFAGSSLESTVSDPVWLSTALEQISVERMMADIRTLTAPAYQGRLTGSPQDEASATFIANRFADLRLQRSSTLSPENRTDPSPEREWKQTASVATRTISEPSLMELLTTAGDRHIFEAGSQFLPILDSPSADIRGPVVFVGYGIVDPSSGIDDYAGVDVHNAVVLFLRGKPESYSKTVTHAEKERLAKQRGAIGYLTATGPILSAYEQRRGVTGKPSAYYSTTAKDDQLPGAWISTETAEWLLARATKESTTLHGIQETLNRLRSRSFTTDSTVQMKWTSQVGAGTLFNVISVIRGYAPNKDEAVLIGAHRDHFGQQAGLLFAGADDNASGTAVLLEIARVLALAPAPAKRSVLFVSFSGEEQGLLGSKLYVSQPIMPFEKTTVMINVDHAGAGNGRLTVGVTGLEKHTAQRIGELAALADKLDVFGYFPGGDHVPFKEAGVPTVTVVSGGVHPHFHQPSDTADRIDPEILRSVARYALAVAWQLANQP